MDERPIRDSSYALLDQIPLGVCVLSPSLEVCFWNTCLESWTGIARLEIVGTDLSQRFSHLREMRYRKRLELIFEGGPPTVFSSQLHRHLIPAPLPNGQLRIQHTVVTAIAAPDGGFHAMLSIQDVTDLTRRLEEHRELRHQALREARERQRAEEERRRLETKLQHSQKLESLAVLAGGIAHDFNNLLVGILGNADLALAKETQDSPRRKFLRSIIKSSQRAADLSNQMLAFSGKGRFVTSVLDLSQAVRDVVHLLEVSLSKRASVGFDLPSNELCVEADPTQIRQLLINLITNASDAIDESGGEIRVCGGILDCDTAYLAESALPDDLPAGHYVYCDISDDGPGMDTDTVSKIFDPFFTTKFAGRGLGLAAALGIVRGHRGAIRVESAPGRGTTMRVLLPASSRPLEPAALPTRRVEIEGTGTILVVDDEKAVRMVACSVLEEAGFEVLTASDGDEGIEVFKEQRDRVTLVLLDLTMPRLSGHDTLLELRRIRPEVTVVLSSGYSEQVARDQFGDQLISGFLQKPYGPADLLAKVRDSLGDAPHLVSPAGSQTSREGDSG